MLTLETTYGGVVHINPAAIVIIEENKENVCRIYVNGVGSYFAVICNVSQLLLSVKVALGKC